MSGVTGEIERVNNLRESLVQGVQGAVSKQTFQAVCRPVGLELKKFANSQGFQVKQVSLKFRNPNHQPNSIEKGALKTFDADSNLLSLWKQTPTGTYYFRRITVRQACLNCHGPKSTRPEFIKKKYPADKAFDFKVGDLRGMYSVFVPKPKK